MKADLHTHTIFSDGIISPEQVVRIAKRTGLDAVAITDHNTTEGWARAQAAGHELGIDVIQGEEITIKQNGWKVGELLCLFIQEGIRGKRELCEIQAIIDRVKQQGGIVIIPHPFDYWIIRNGLSRKTKLLDLFEKNAIKIDGIEILNSKTIFLGNFKSAQYAKRMGLLGTAGSDAHCAQEVGLCYTKAEACSLEEFRRALETKRVECYGSAQPFFRKLAHAIYETVYRVPSRWTRAY